MPRAAATGHVLLVVPAGAGAIDRYAQHLGEHLAVETLVVDGGARNADLFQVPLVSRASLRALAADVALVRRLRRARGLVHFPHQHHARYAPFLRGPYVVTVHDLIRWFDLTGAADVLITRPNARDRLCLRLDYRAIGRAPALVAVSETTKRDVVRHLGVREERVFVVHEGIDHALFRPVERRPVAGRYLLFVGSEHPRKNLPTLLRAFALLKRDPAFADVRLVKVGAAGSGEAPFRDETLAVVRALGLEQDVVFTGPMAERDLPGYYSGAACLVLPSRSEGFGFPPIEAMACGCPVVVSTAGSLPEITGGAALTVPPLDVEALVATLRRILGGPALAAELRRRGLERAREFSWDRAARETVAVYDEVAARFEKYRSGV